MIGDKPQSSVKISTKLERVAKLAREAPDMAFRSLAHLIDTDWLHEAYRRTRKGGARGVDGQSAQEYQANLEDNLRSLLERAKSGTYRAPPVRRVHIPKGSGSETRPLGIPTPSTDCPARSAPFGMRDHHAASPSPEGHSLAHDPRRARTGWPTVRRRGAPSRRVLPASSGVDGSSRTLDRAASARS